MNNAVAVHTSGSMMITGNEFTMNSYDFLKDVINPIRVQNGEPEIRNANFVARIEDELDFDDFDALKVMRSINGSPDMKTYDLNIKQMTLIGMRESKGCRRQVLEYIETLENSMAPKTPALPNFSNPADAARAWANEYEARQQAQAQLAIAAPKVEFVDQYTSRETLQNASSVAGTFGMGVKKFNLLLTDNGVYNKKTSRKTFCAWFVDKGYGLNIQTANGYAQAMFTPAGIFWISANIINTETPLEKLLLN